MANELPLTGVKAVVDNVENFLRDIGNVSKKIEESGKASDKAAKQNDPLAKGYQTVEKAVTKLTSSLGGMGGAVGKTSSVLQDVLPLLGGVSVTALAAVGAATALAGAFLALGQRGSTLSGVADSFDRLSASVGTTSQRLLVDLRAAAEGTVSDFELIRQANVALVGATGQFGTELGQKLPKLLEIARASARATGQDVDYMYQSIITGVKRGSPMLLDNLGLIVKVGKANDDYAKSIGKTAAELTEEEKKVALLNAVLESGGTLITSLGNAHETAAAKIARGQATITNILDGLALSVQPAYEVVLDGVNKVLAIFQQLAQGIGPILNAVTSTIANVFGAALDIVLALVQPIIDEFTSFLPYISILFQGIGNIISGVAQTISNVVSGIVKFLQDVAKNLFGLDLKNMGRNLFEGAAKVFGAFANGIIQAANTLIFPAIIGIAKFIADFLVGHSPPPKGPLAEIDKGGYNTMMAWLSGVTGVSLDPVVKVVSQVSEALGGIGQASLPQVKARLAQLDKELLPFQQRLDVVKARFEEIATPAKAALEAIDRQIQAASEALATGDVQAAETIRNLDAMRASVQGMVDARQQDVDQAQIQLALMQSSQSQERTLLNIRQAQLAVTQQTASVAQKAAAAQTHLPQTKAGKAGTPTTEPPLGGGLPITLPKTPKVSDLISGQQGVNDAIGGIQDSFASQIDTSGLQTMGKNIGDLQTQMGRIGSADLGKRLGDVFGGIFDPTKPDSVVGKVRQWLSDLVDPSKPDSIPGFISSIPDRISTIASTVRDSLMNFFTSIFSADVQGSPAQTLYALTDMLFGSGDGSIVGFIKDVPNKLQGILGTMISGIGTFFSNLFSPDVQGSPAQILYSLTNRLFGSGSGSIIGFISDLPNQLAMKLPDMLVGLTAFFNNLFSKDIPGSPGQILYSLISGLLGPDSADSILSFFRNLPTNAATAAAGLFDELDKIVFAPLRNFLTGSDEGTLSAIIGSALKFFSEFPGQIILALKGLGKFFWDAFAKPVINGINALITTVETAVNNILAIVSNTILQAAAAYGAAVGILKGNMDEGTKAAKGFADQFIGITNGVHFARLSAEAPAFLQAAPGGAAGGLFSSGMMKVGERGTEYMMNASKMAVFPNSFVTAVESLTDAINGLMVSAMPYPLAGAGVTNNSSSNAVTYNNTFNGVQGADDAMLRMARLKAGR